MHRAWAGQGLLAGGAGALPPLLPRRLVPPAPPDRGARLRRPCRLARAPRPVRGRPERPCRRRCRAICEWLGIDGPARAIETMSHPEDSPYAVLGPESRCRRLGRRLPARPRAEARRAARIARPPRGLGRRPVARAREPRAREAAWLLLRATRVRRCQTSVGAPRPPRQAGARRSGVPGTPARDARARPSPTSSASSCRRRSRSSSIEEHPDRIAIVLPVDLAGLGEDAVWAMTGRPPDA